MRRDCLQCIDRGDCINPMEEGGLTFAATVDQLKTNENPKDLHSSVTVPDSHPYIPLQLRAQGEYGTLLYRVTGVTFVVDHLLNQSLRIHATP